MIVDHRLLDRVQRPVRPLQMLDRDDMLTVHRGEEPDAGIDALIGQFTARKSPDQNRAGAAMALRAAFLGTDKAAPQPQEVEKRLVGLHIGERDLPAVEQEADVRSDFR